MRLSRKGEYACLALTDLSEHYKHGLVKIKDIQLRKNIPRKYLEQILLLLKRARYLKSTTGSNGGYALAKDPSKISLAEIIRLMDGALAPVASASKYYYQSTPIDKQKKLLHIFKDIRNYIADKLENTTFADII
jgi:Rrf2 family transcriptional regulator, cysteine metabolism repressor